MPPRPKRPVPIPAAIDRRPRPKRKTPAAGFSGGGRFGSDPTGIGASGFYMLSPAFNADRSDRSVEGVSACASFDVAVALAMVFTL